MSNNGRNPDGTFGKGNKVGKKDFTKEMATHIANQELYWAIRQCTQPFEVLKALVNSKDIEKESLFTYMAIKKAVNGDMKALQWIWEMAVGKPKQQLEHSGGIKPIGITIDKQDEGL